MVILTKAILTTVRDFGEAKQAVKEFTQITLNMPAKLNRQLVLLKLNCKAHLVNNLLTNMLIETDILGLHRIIINIVKGQATVRACQDAVINLQIKTKANHQTQLIYNKQQVVISLRSEARLLIKLVAK